MPASYVLEEPDLLRAAEQAGHKVTSAQLERWYRAGLLPRPLQDHPAGRHGSRSRYPAWAAAQIVAIAELRSQMRRLKDLAVAVWWNGHWVEPHALRDALIAPLEPLSREAQAIRRDDPDPYDAADTILAHTKRRSRPSVQEVLMRRRIAGRKADFDVVAWTFYVVAFGGEVPWEHEDLSRPDQARTAIDLFADAVGITRALRDRPAGMGPWLPADFDPGTFLVNLRNAGAFDTDDLARTIRGATDAQLATARDDARLITEGLATITTTIEGFAGEDVAGLGSVRAMLPVNSLGRAMMIRTVLILREMDGGRAFAEIRALVDAEQRRFAAITQLRVAFPQHAEILGPAFARHLESMSDDNAASLKIELTAYLGQHPEIAAALGSG